MPLVLLAMTILHCTIVVHHQGGSVQISNCDLNRMPNVEMSMTPTGDTILTIPQYDTNRLSRHQQ